MATITNVLNWWEYQGVFAYVLPFLLIFAVIFGILNNSKVLGSNKGVQATVALSIGLLALQFDYVSTFFATIFPYTGMAISVLVVSLILIGIVSNGKQGESAKWIWFGLGIIAFLVVAINSFADYSWWGSGVGQWVDAWPAIIVAIIILGAMGWVIFGDKKSGGP